MGLKVTHLSASAAHSGNGVHFFGRLYVGYENRATASAEILLTALEIMAEKVD